MRRLAVGLVVFSALLISVGCEPQDRRPGLWLRGDVHETPADWSFTRAHKEIAVQVATPYLLPHSVTVWCTDVDGGLYLAAFGPDSKNWPGWVRDDSDVRLKIDHKLYDVSLQELEDANAIGPVQLAYGAKYDRDVPSDPAAIRYWLVTPRAG